MTDRHPSAPPRTPSRVTRRNLTRGAVWAVPAVSALAAAPAFAASGSSGPLFISPTFVRWSSGQSTSNSELILDFSFDNKLGDSDASLLSAQVYSTYHSPATNGAGDQLVQTADLSYYTIAAGRWLGIGFSMINRPQTGTHTVLPHNGNKDITLKYYNGSTRPPPCVGSANHGAADYPHVCTQLVDNDHTYVVFTYTVGGVTYTHTSTLATAFCAVDNVCVS